MPYAKTRAAKDSAAYKKKRKKAGTREVGSKTTKHKIKKSQKPKKTGMRSYTSKVVLG